MLQHAVAGFVMTNQAHDQKFQTVLVRPVRVGKE